MTAGSALGRAARFGGYALATAARWSGRRAHSRAVHVVGGEARARVIFLFGAVQGHNSADTATVGAIAGELEPALHIGNAKIGLLSTGSLLVGALATLPVGLLVDRINRMRLLAVSVVLWSVASFASGLAGSYSTLLLTRLALGFVAASAGPAIASLTGDYFPARERGRVYGYILSGDLAGSAAGFIICGAVASLLSWRFAFFALALPGFFLARTLWSSLPEPQRGGASRLERGTVDLHAAARGGGTDASTQDDEESADDNLAHRVARERQVTADERRVLREDPRSMSLARAVRYIMRVPTNVVMIISSALGYFFLSGLMTFALVFVRGHYHASQATATGVLGLLVIGALIGTLVSGRLTDALLRRGFLNARVWVPAIAYPTAALLLVPGLVSSSLTPAIWFDVAGAAMLAAANPPLDAARLDIMPAGLWGRAESTRTLLRTGGQALAPLIFGAIADLIAGFYPQKAPIGTKPGAISAATATGLEYTFLLMLTTLVAAGLILLKARRSYPGDVATAAAASTPREEQAA